MKIALLTEILAPFRVPLFNALAAEDGIDLRVLFLARNDPRRNYVFYGSEANFDWEILRGFDRTLGGRWVVVNAGVRGRLAELDPDVAIVGGWNQPAFMSALLTKRAVVVWSESTARDERQDRLPPDLLKRFVVRRAAGFLVPGRAAREYVESLGASPDRIVVAPNAIDLSIFRVDPAPKSGRVTFLCVSRLSREKGVDVLVKAMEGVDADLLVVGSGPDEARVRDLAPANVTFLGNMEREDLPSLYARADAFVMPSRSETWGMSMQEAAAAGLPLVATEAPGAGHDLIDEGVNGYRVPVDDVEALQGALERVAADAAWRERARPRTLELAAGHTPEAWAAAVAGLVRRLA